MSSQKCNKAGNEHIVSGKPQGTIFGGMDVRMIKRLRQRQAAKAATTKLYKQNNNGFKNA